MGIVNHYIKLNRIFYIYVLIILGVKYSNGVMLHQLQQAVLAYEGVDLFYWSLIGMQIPQWIISSSLISSSIDILLFITALLSIFYPNKWIKTIFAVLYFTYFFTYNTFAAHHYHSIGILFFGFFFILPKNSKNLEVVFRALRYFFFFMMISAFCWKFFRLNWLDMEHFTNVLKSQNLYLIDANPEHWRSKLILKMIFNPLLAHAFWIGLMLIQFSFILGVFSLKYDRLLALFYCLFIIGSWIFMDILNYDNLIWLLVFYPAMSKGLERFTNPNS